MIWTIVFAILLFSLIIFVHELGHFLTARLFRVKVHEFAIGMGPQLFSRQGKGDTKYSIRAIPVGGFCSMEGEDEQSNDAGSFSAKPWWQKLIILAAGSAMNIVLGFLIFAIFVSVFYQGSGIPTTTVDTVIEQSALYGELQPGDRIVAINDSRINIKRDIDFAMQRYSGGECTVTVKRDGEKLSFPFKPIEAKYTDGSPAYLIGITSAMQKVGVMSVIRESFYQTVWMGKVVFVSLGMLISGEVGVGDMSGPVGVVDAMNSAVNDAASTAPEGQGMLAGLLALLSLASFISVNIGIMNLLPIPALDGGRIFFVIIEAIRRKPIPPEKEGIVHFIGLVLLLGVMVFATWNDIMRLISRF
ncbi:MAG: RIP metalloprotease RseP [Clostridia bacterium]|nr:RIP metalloprotease RseP [Clostridia bacterium]